MTTGLKAGISAVIGLGTAGGVGSAYFLMSGTTIKDELNGKIKLISEDAEEGIWTIAFKENKNTKELTEINPKITTFNNLKEWCLNNYKKQSNNKKILEKVKKLCEIPPSTIAEKLKKDKKDYVEEWGTKLEAIKQNSEQLGRLKLVDSSLSNVDSTNDGKNKLEQWCLSQKEQKLNPANYEEDYKKVVEFCTT